MRYRDIQRHIGGAQKDRVNPDQFSDIDRRMKAGLDQAEQPPQIAGQPGSEHDITFHERLEGVELHWRNNAWVSRVFIYASQTNNPPDKTTDYIGSIQGDKFYFKGTPGTWYFMLIPQRYDGMKGSPMYGSAEATDEFDIDVNTQTIVPLTDASWHLGAGATRYSNLYLRHRIQFNATNYIRWNATDHQIEVIISGQMVGRWHGGTYYGPSTPAT